MMADPNILCILVARYARLQSNKEIYTNAYKDKGSRASFDL